MDECQSFKKEYDKCFNTWFRDKFLKGSNDDSVCSELLKNYTGCVKVNYNLSCSLVFIFCFLINVQNILNIFDINDLVINYAIFNLIIFIFK